MELLGYPLGFILGMLCLIPGVTPILITLVTSALYPSAVLTSIISSLIFSSVGEAIAPYQSGEPIASLTGTQEVNPSWLLSQIAKSKFIGLILGIILGLIQLKFIGMIGGASRIIPLLAAGYVLWELSKKNKFQWQAVGVFIIGTTFLFWFAKGGISPIFVVGNALLVIPNLLDKKSLRVNQGNIPQGDVEANWILLAISGYIANIATGVSPSAVALLNGTKGLTTVITALSCNALIEGFGLAFGAWGKLGGRSIIGALLRQTDLSWVIIPTGIICAFLAWQIVDRIKEQAVEFYVEQYVVTQRFAFVLTIVLILFGGGLWGIGTGIILLVGGYALSIYVKKNLPQEIYVLTFLGPILL